MKAPLAWVIIAIVGCLTFLCAYNMHLHNQPFTIDYEKFIGDTYKCNVPSEQVTPEIVKEHMDNLDKVIEYAYR